MIQRIGNAFYWAGCIIAIALLFAVSGYHQNNQFFLIDFFIFIGGWLLRYIITGNKSFKP